MSDTIPTQHTAGDTFTATLDGAQYPPADGWAAQLVLVGPTRHVIDATTSGSNFAATATAATTAAWPAGDYAVRLTYTNGAARSSSSAGNLRVLPDPAAATTDAMALKSTAQRVLDDLMTAYQAHLTGGQVHVAEYTINGRAMKFRGIAELLTAINAARRDVEAEKSAARVAAGLSPRVRYVTRM